jgi:uncharacterized protein (DUF169 family)
MKRSHDLNELTQVLVELAEKQEPPVNAELVQSIVEVESAYFEERAEARRRVEELVEKHLKAQ